MSGWRDGNGPDSRRRSPTVLARPPPEGPPPCAARCVMAAAQRLDGGALALGVSMQQATRRRRPRHVAERTYGARSRAASMAAPSASSHASARGIRSLTPPSHHRLNTGSTSAAARIVTCVLLARRTATGRTCARCSWLIPYASAKTRTRCPASAPASDGGRSRWESTTADLDPADRRTLGRLLERVENSLADDKPGDGVRC